MHELRKNVHGAAYRPSMFAVYTVTIMKEACIFFCLFHLARSQLAWRSHNISISESNTSATAWMNILHIRDHKVWITSQCHSSGHNYWGGGGGAELVMCIIIYGIAKQNI